MFNPVFPDAVRIDVRLDGGPDWTELLDVENTSAISTQRGNDGTSQKDRVAASGSLEFKLDNSERNSQDTLGLYSPNNVNVLPGWRVGIPVRCVIVYAGQEEVIFIGKVEAIQPISGKYKDRQVNVSCSDWMEEAARSRIRGLELQINQRSSTVFQIVAEAVEEPPPGGFSVAPGADTFPYALDSAHDGELNAMSEFQRITQSSLERMYVTREGVAVYESRHTRPNTTAVFAIFTDEEIDAVEAGRGREDVINHVEVQAHPRRVDAAPTTVLFELAQPKKVAVGETVELSVLLRDPDSRATRVGGRDMVQPQPTSDYLFNSLQDGTGIDKTTNVTAAVYTDSTKTTVGYSANGGTAVVTNNGPGDGYLTKLQCRGRGIYDYETVLVQADDQPSKDKYGEAGTSFDMPYQADFGVAKDAAEYILNQSKELWTQIRAVRFWANNNDTLMLAALRGEISKKISLQETVIGSRAFVPGDPVARTINVTTFFINSVRLEIMERGIIRCAWTLEPADPFTYWILEDPVYGVLDQTTRLAYGSFQTGWTMDVSALNVDTVLGSS